MAKKDNLIYKTKGFKRNNDIFGDKKDYVGIHGFKNGAPAHASSDWGEVDLFLHTWDFLPNDNSVLETLSKEQLIELCMAAMSSCCRMDFTGRGIKFTQELMHKYNISPETRKNNKLK